MEKHLKLYYIYDEYIDYLRKYDNIVPFNKNKTRPYIGIVYTHNGFNYFAPLSSPKEKHLKMNPGAVDIFKIDNGRLGIININNMIPAPIECLQEVLPTIKDIEYKKLLEKQLSSINNPSNIQKLFNKINRFTKEYKENTIPENIKARCCNFPLLEEKCREWEKELESELIKKKNMNADEDIDM